MKNYDDMKNTSIPHPELPLQESAPKFFVMLCRDGKGMSEFLITIIVLAECISTLFCVGLTIVDGGCDRISLSGCFTCQMELWECTDDLNVVGRVIAVCLATPFILPCNFLFLISYILLSIGVFFWKIYKRIFKKTERRDDP